MQETFEHYRTSIANTIINQSTTNLMQTSLSSLVYYTSTIQSEFSSIVYEPSLCIVLQGAKSVSFGDDVYCYSPSRYLLVLTHIPANVKIQEASIDKPYVGIKLSFTYEQIYDVLKEIQHTNIYPTKRAQMGLYFGSLDVELLEPIYRLINTTSKDNNTFFANLVTKEIIYKLLIGNSGDFLRQYIMEGSTTKQVVKAISHIKDNYSQQINMKDLAKNISMSESSLYHNFKKITSMSPLQFQKKIRLEEAKQMLLMQDIEASQVAFDVGYESPSQFNREYSRMYGMPPKTHITHLKNIYLQN